MIGPYAEQLNIRASDPEVVALTQLVDLFVYGGDTEDINIPAPDEIGMMVRVITPLFRYVLRRYNNAVVESWDKKGQHLASAIHRLHTAYITERDV